MTTEQQLTQASEQMHQQWLNSPVTRTVIEALKKHKQKFINQAVTSSTDYTIPDQAIRLQIAQVKSIDAVLIILNDYGLIKSLTD